MHYYCYINVFQHIHVFMHSYIQMIVLKHLYTYVHMLIYICMHKLSTFNLDGDLVLNNKLKVCLFISLYVRIHT